MRLNIAAATAVIAFGLIIDVSGAPAQPRRDQPGTVTFKTPDVITADTARMNALRTQLRLADTRIMDYLRQSMLAVQQGHRNGLQHFAVWYRNREEARKTSTEEIAKAIVKEALGKGLELIFPESTPFVEALKFVANGSMEAADKLLKVPERDVNLFLEQLRTAEEEHIRRLLDTPDEFRRQHAAELEAAKWEYVEQWMEDETSGPQGQDLPPSVQKMLDALGVPPPGSATAQRVAEGVLTSHIHTIYINDDAVVTGAGPHSLWDFARVSALRQIDLKGNTARICDIERGFNPFFRSIKQQDCDTARGGGQ